MFLNDGDHPMVKHKDKIVEFLDEIKKMVKDDGAKIDEHLQDGCPECKAAADEIRQKVDALEDLADGFDGDLLVETGIIDEDGM